MNAVNVAQMRDVMQKKTLVVTDSIKPQKMQLQLPLAYHHFQLAYKRISRIKLITASSTGPFFSTQKISIFYCPATLGSRAKRLAF